MKDQHILFALLGITLVNLYITWRIADGLQSVSNTANTIGGLVGSLTGKPSLGPVSGQAGAGAYW